jgi:hypothetical protein
LLLQQIFLSVLNKLAKQSQMQLWTTTMWWVPTTLATK